ncbi:ROK family transcriptional regulator [Paenibacillus senegalensis]|uniref:ROK family transcriptional regulator n=1 Tax=Paenibacillus senegalensis TaxID=1465766 RepID=UPI000474F96D|nr:ROK family transcriptional regulator [Paenibacillus senegalensis]
MKQTNARTVFQLIHENRNLSRAKIAQMTNLSRTTISAIVEQLMERGMVIETAPLEGNGAGRKAISLEVNPSNKHVIGVELGVEKISGTVFNLRNEPVHSETIRLAERDDIGESIRAVIDRLRDAVKHRFDELMGICVGVPGLLDSDKKTILMSTLLNIENVNLYETIAKGQDVPVYLEDGTVLAATAERVWMGNADSPFIYLSIDEGLGASVIMDNQHIQGVNKVMLEIGHMSLDMNGDLCKCGNRGCFELYVSTLALAKKVKQAILDEPASLLGRIMGEDGKKAVEIALLEAANAGDETACRIISEVAAVLGNGIVNLIHIFNPQMIVIGGRLSTLGTRLLGGVEEQIADRAIRSFSKNCSIRLRYNNDNAVVFGACHYALGQVLDSYFAE